MSEFAPYIVVGWVALMVGVFPALRPRRSVLLIVLSGTLFLPELREEIALGPIHFSKYHAISYAALLGSLLFDSERLFGGRPRLIDVPMLVWCACPFVSVLTNDPPPDGSSAIRDALAQTWTQTVSFGIPYLLGRVYFCGRESLRDLALAVILAAAVYTPLCLYEIRMSPQLHARVYGYSQHSFAQTIRFGGYRPMVFLPHGLALGMFMVSASLFACWMWWAGALEPEATGPQSDEHGRLRYLPLVLVPTTVLLKSAGALALGLIGGAALWLGRATGSRVWLLLLVAVPMAYVSVRSTGTWSGESMVSLAKSALNEDRAESLEFRLMNEDMLAKKALERPAFGWGGWGRGRVTDEESEKDISVTDGLWIIVLGDRGLIGLAALGAVLLVPVVRFAIGFEPSTWANRSVAPVAVCAVVIALWTIDCLLNAMVLPVYLVIIGGLSGIRPDEAADAGSGAS